MNRRKFLFNTGITAAGLALGCDMKAATTANKQHLIGLQLYSVRDELKIGLDKVFEKIAAAGYGSVEMFGFSEEGHFFNTKPAATSELLKKNGLVSPSGHYMLDLFNKDGQQTVDAALALGHQYVTIPWFPPEQRSKLDDYKKIADRINKAAKLCKENNLKMAYHNHEFEFIKYENGVSGYDILIEQCDKDLVDLELDLYWVQYAKENPVKIFSKAPGRFKMWHVKDMSKSDPATQTEVGSGSIDFTTIFNNAELSGMEYFFVEQENLPVPGDANIKKSHDYVKAKLVPLLNTK
ncbi:MAG TPA: sugar phosphate isomerase/epimerase [Ferruginibacter sp.]|nr:sugar phosphate isomerase/epimerase [Ferruginibacter sp.]HPH92073.1 sugar phosphate isomerase/epimerase [Ferruginibacter sp.]